MSLADSLDRSARVTALEETTLLWMDQAAFRASVEEIPVLARNLANLLSRHLRLTNTHVRTLAALDVPGRVAAQIRGLGEGVRAALARRRHPHPHAAEPERPGALVGASRVRVNQALGYFRGRGAISSGKDGRITVIDAEVLAQRAR